MTPIVELASHRSILTTELDAGSGGPLSLFGSLAQVMALAKYWLPLVIVYIREAFSPGIEAIH